ncbi:MAG: cupin domain-containing protein [Candidatus Thiodiazotropha sp. (ex Rostrolucina anterorostrata)]|nr:cupin domain-containing protein [Candidatus Thiodiazotropha sp. (ex Rostrolucina anterorostrata)]
MQVTKMGHQPAFKDDDRENEIDGDLTIPAILETSHLVWEASPALGVQRKRLELIGQSLPQLTTLVCFAPGSNFAVHTHDGGEEFLVLSGIFSDASGDYKAGSYVRNPPGTRHAPFTRDGCTILVKLRQFQPGDNRQCSIDTRQADTNLWHEELAGIKSLMLHNYRDEQVQLLRPLPDTLMAAYNFYTGVEIFVTEGRLSIDQRDMSAGCWLRYPLASRLKLQTEEGCLLYVKQGPASRYGKTCLWRLIEMNIHSILCCKPEMADVNPPLTAQPAEG